MSEKINSEDLLNKEDKLIHENYASQHFDLHENDWQTCFGVQGQFQIPGSNQQLICPDRIQTGGGFNPWPGPNGQPPWGIQINFCWDLE